MYSSKVRSVLSSTRSHLLTATTRPLPSSTDVARHVGVLRRQPFDGIDDEDGDVGPRHRRQGAHRRVALGGLSGRHLPAPPDPGGVDEHRPRSDPTPGGCRWRRASCPGTSRDDRPFLSQQRVQQARLADVRPTDERDRGRCRIGLGGDRRVPPRRLSVLGHCVPIAVQVVFRFPDDERLEPAGGDFVRPGLGLCLALLTGDFGFALWR